MTHIGQTEDENVSALQARTYAWFKKNGGRANDNSAYLLLCDKVQALGNSLLRHPEPTEVRSDLASVGLSLLVLAQVLGVDLLTAMDGKQTVNEFRNWKVNEKGYLSLDLDLPKLAAAVGGSR